MAAVRITIIGSIDAETGARSIADIYELDTTTHGRDSWYYWFSYARSQNRDRAAVIITTDRPYVFPERDVDRARQLLAEIVETREKLVALEKEWRDLIA